MFEAILAKTATMRAQMDALRKEAAEQVKPLLSEFVKSNPQVKAVKWTQYTPYFNDGDTCTFGINAPEFFFHDTAGNDDEDEDDAEGYGAWNLKPERDQWSPSVEVCSPETAAACVKLAEALDGIEEALEECFGDHVKVIVTANGVEVDEYDHD